MTDQKESNTVTEIELEWKEPPPELRKGRGKHERAVTMLKANPGQWALVQKDMESTGAAMTWRSRGCETTTRPAASGAKGKRDVYARWPPPGAPEPAPVPPEFVPPRTWTVNGRQRVDPPPEPLPVRANETPREAAARRSADRIAMDRWKRGAPGGKDVTRRRAQ